MVNFEKNPTAPPSLAACRSWRGQDVIDNLCRDFHDKCYICGNKYVPSLNVEHFDEHRQDPNKMYDWKNLYYACALCNGVKNQLFPKGPSNLLNCIDSSHKVDFWIKYRVEYDSKIKTLVKFADAYTGSDSTIKTKTQNTVTMLDKVFNGSGTPTRNKEAEYLTIRLQEELSDFKKSLLDSMSHPESEDKVAEINEKLKIDSPFAAFKRWIIRDMNLTSKFPC